MAARTERACSVFLSLRITINWLFMLMPDLRRTAAFLCAAVLSLTSVFASAQAVPWRTQITASPDAQSLPADRGADGLAVSLPARLAWARTMASFSYLLPHANTS